jgi:hypothetical protein
MKTKIQLFRQFIFLFTGILLFSSCQENCACNEEEMETFLFEMNFRYGKDLTKDSIVCRKRDGLWMVKRHDYLDWQIMYDEQQIDRHSAMVVYKMPIRYAKLIIPFIRHVREYGWEVEYVEKEAHEDSLFSFKLYEPNGNMQVKQCYKFKGKGWTKKFDISAWSVLGEDVDLSRK